MNNCYDCKYCYYEFGCRFCKFQNYKQIKHPNYKYCQYYKQSFLTKIFDIFNKKKNIVYSKNITG